MAKREPADPVMERVRQLFERKKMTLEELATAMGYTGDAARTSAWQFLRKSRDPRVSMLRKAAKALGVRMRDLFPD